MPAARAASLLKCRNPPSARRQEASNSYCDWVTQVVKCSALIQDAERSEHAETVQLAGRYANSQSAVVARAAESRHADLKPDTSTDRRRPGRRDEVNPALIPLLREESNEGLPLERADDGFDSLRGSRGIIIWTLVAAAGWVSFGLWIALGR